MRFVLAALGVALVCLSCSSESGVVEVTETDTASAVDAGFDGTIPPDLALADVTGETEELDVGSLDAEEDMPSVCEGEGGCFLDPCQENVDCQSAWCVEHLGAGVCTRTCQEDCPPGWLCKQVGAAEPDLTYVCVSQHANLCKPCNDGADCKTVGGVDDVCVDYDDEGAFCGGTCAADEDCPWGFSCEDTLTIDGIATWQCVAEAGVCPCTDKSVSLSLWTACDATNEFGTCLGKRVCADDGLTDCDAILPAAEVCNGQDDDCDGEVDEPNVVDGGYVDLCDDGNDCTEDGCAGEDGCTHAALSEGECVDGDVCTVGDHCEAGVCVGSPVACDDDNPCTDDVCDGLGGCEFLPNNLTCDDGDPCTVADHCEDSLCVGVAVICACQTDGDCAALEDGDLCNGTLVCDLESVPYQCTLDPATTITCPAPDGPDAFCLQALCDPGSGACLVAPDHEGLLCDDGDACTVNATCQEGACSLGVPVSCSDGDPCTNDACDPESGCLNAPNEGPCDDGNVCTTGDACEGGTCTYDALLDCDDGNLCTDDSCAPATGCIHSLNQAPCNDADICTFDDHCHLGECIAGQALTCDDGNVCTDDACSPLSGCSFTINDAFCDDGNSCTLGDSCSQGWCLPGPTQDCDDGDLCTDDICNPESGCIHTHNSTPCDDGDLCTTDDACVAGTCSGGPALDCDDLNPCSDDACDPLSGCVHADNAAGCEDGNACTTGDHCVEGVCVTGSGALECKDDNACTDDGCNPEIGCIFVNNSVPCTDGDACTDPDMCVSGACVSGEPVICIDDGNTCTTHACDSESGCVTAILPDCCGNGFTEAGEDCDDGNQASGDGCSDTCASEVGSCFGDWKVGLPCNGVDYGGGCTPAETGYHWKGIYGSYACWWNTKNQAWNSPATNPYQLAQFFGLNVGTGKVQWCSSFSSTPNPSSYSNCTGYCQINDDHMWGWCGGAPFTNGGWICFNHGGKQPCN